ncbi:LOW QUALITY PROTEIN: MICOS complex subunit MIC10 [Ctenodactylus gundi]
MSESDLSRKRDRCMADAVMQIGTSFRLGVVFLSLSLKERMKPLGFGSGMGLRMAYCQHNFQACLLHEKYVKEQAQGLH